MFVAARIIRRSWPMTSVPWLAHAAAAFGSAALIRATLPPFDMFPLAFVSWVPLLLLAKRTQLKSLMVWSVGHAVLLNAVTHWWLVPAMQYAISVASPTAWGILGVFSALQGTRTPLVILLVAMGLRRSLPIWLTFPIATALVERVHPHFFPWTMALQVHSCPIWLQAASVGGLAAVSVWLALINALLAEAWSRRHHRRAWLAHIAYAFAVFGGASLFGHFAQQARYAAEHTAEVGRAVLGHVGSPRRQNAREAVSELRTHTGHALLRYSSVDFVLWPESTLAMPTDIASLQRVARDYLYRDRLRPSSPLVFNAPLLFGAIVQDKHGFYNSAVLTNSVGSLLGRYDKQYLIPIGETNQLVPWSQTLEVGLPAANRFTPGTAWNRFVVNGHGILPSICYEGILGDEIRSAVIETSPELLVNLTSDAWFAGTDAIELHFALAKLRCVEYAKYLIRSSRDGVSAVVDSTGRVRHRVAIAATRAEVVEFRWLPGQTLYAKHGDSWLWLLAGALCIAYVGAGQRRNSQQGGSEK
jgi:apolipoprotein N-acyltransferase